MKKLFILIITISFASCSGLWIEENPQNKKLEMFDTLWEDLDAHYVFFDQKQIDWQAARDEYRLQIDENMTDQAYFDLLSGLLSELKDGHVSLFSGFNNWFYYDFYLNEPANFNFNFIERTYLNYQNTIGPFVYDILDGNIGYLYYASFGDDFTDEELAYLLDYFKNTKGLIFDIRDNTGGAADNINQLMSILLNEDLVIGKTFTPDMEGNLIEKDIEIKKHNEITSWNKDIVLLTNRKCYSSANVFAGFMSTLENVTIVGDATGGGSGLAVGSELANGWRYRYSGAKITLADKTEIELGIAPDIEVTTGPDDELNNQDAIIEMAKSLF
jgi:hypothetical protein